MKDKIMMWAAKMAIPSVVKMVQDMMRSTDLTGMRDKLVAKIAEIAQKTNTPIDDKLVEHIIPLFFAPEFICNLIEDILPPVRAFVLNSETAWDDKMFLPILDTLEEMIKDVEECPAEQEK